MLNLSNDHHRPFVVAAFKSTAFGSEKETSGLRSQFQPQVTLVDTFVPASNLIIP
jgi:hypothetical protein